MKKTNYVYYIFIVFLYKYLYDVISKCNLFNSKEKRRKRRLLYYLSV